ncbi:MAG: hypothetical protein WA816_08870 [Bacteroidales bacterium]
METIGHHTCDNVGGYDYVFETAPFISEFNEKEKKKPFLGTGYYFWDATFQWLRIGEIPIIMVIIVYWKL